MIKFFKSLLGSGSTTLSSKRFTGIICVLSLVISLFVSLFSAGEFTPNESLIDVIALLAFGSLGLTSTEVIFSKNKDNKKEDTQEPS
jgi:uncharacterized membrane protein YbhN (UPF0104 family)